MSGTTAGLWKSTVQRLMLKSRITWRPALRPSAKQRLARRLGDGDRIGSRTTRCNLNSVAEESLHDFLVRMPSHQPDEFARFRHSPPDALDRWLSSLCTNHFFPDMDVWDETDAFSLRVT
eukprot:2215353-Amphidinium_carterae.1